MMVFIKWLKSIFFKTNARTIFSIYLIFGLVASFILWLPISLKEGVKLSYIDALFIAISQISSTGLTPVSVTDTFNLFGGIVSILILQIGGIGIVLLIAAYWVISGKRIGLRERNIIAAEQNQFTVKGIVKLIWNALTAILILQFIYIILLSTYLVIKQPWQMHYGEALFHSFYLAVSGFGNAGFEMFPANNSFIVFQQQNMYFPQILTAILVFIGGVGFWPLAELTLFVKAKFKKQPYKFSFISKLFVKLHFGLLIISIVVYFLLEYQNTLVYMTPQEAVMNVIFMPTMMRSSGFYNTNTGDWTEATKIFIPILMFIGAAPNSSGGGIRITTLVLVLAALNSYGRHRKQVFMGGKAIKQEAVRRAYSVFSMGVVIVMTSIFFIVLIEKVSFITVFFEVISAFGTVGLSLGFTSTLSTVSKLIIMINMFIGRIGILTFIEILDNKKETINVVAYAERDMMVG